MSKESFTKEYDWNIGSILKHFDYQVVIEQFAKVENKFYLYDSIGLSRVFGEFKIKDSIVVGFLFDVINRSKNPEAWRRAAFSLEKLGTEDAVVLLKHSLKREKLDSVEYYLNNIHNKKSIIGILLHSNNIIIKDIIYPQIKKIFLHSKEKLILINSARLIGRLKLIDKEISEKIVNLIEDSNDYELLYYMFFSIQKGAPYLFSGLLKKYLNHTDPLIRKMAVRGALSTLDINILNDLENLLELETEQSVIGEISSAIYSFKNPTSRNKLILEATYCENENGLIIDDSDKWYGDPDIYDVFSEAEDPENLCFDLVKNKLLNEVGVVKNPIDLATGTGRTFRQILNKIDFVGDLYAVDLNPKMIEFIKKKLDRQKKYTKNTKIICSSIESLEITNKSNFIISSFGFPSKIFDKKLCLMELKKVYNLLDDDGIFVTIGWDETFNDELNEMRYKYIPDSILAYDFESRRYKRSTMIETPRNCGLKRFKRGINVPLQFCGIKESSYVMGHLFGRDAARYVIKNGKTEWLMSLGITYNTKEEISEIIKILDKNI